CDLTTSTPSLNFTPMMTFGNWLWPRSRCQLSSAACASLKIIASAVLFERQPLDRIVRCRTVANVLSMYPSGEHRGRTVFGAIIEGQAATARRVSFQFHGSKSAT